MNELTSQTYRFGQVALILDATPKQVRWLIREAGDDALDHAGSREGPQWHRFSLLDIFRLALMRTLMRYGVDAVDASDIAGAAINTRKLLQSHKSAPARALVAAYALDALIVSRSGDEWVWDVIHPHAINSKSAPSVIDLSALQVHSVIVKLGPLADAILDRIAELLSDYDDDYGPVNPNWKPGRKTKAMPRDRDKD